MLCLLLLFPFFVSVGFGPVAAAFSPTPSDVEDHGPALNAPIAVKKKERKRRGPLEVNLMINFKLCNSCRFVIRYEIEGRIRTVAPRLRHVLYPVDSPRAELRKSLSLHESYRLVSSEHIENRRIEVFLFSLVNTKF